ncbi:MAG: ParB/RepB/Spo0J family partition protein [Sphingobacteriales bacterium JAD_PAG50586_3]|nr:MAG: ParB/RepB/Spo0J family partition protein [Sphingobacteriales bacterium JAD_PAG50586_3]
MSTPKKQALGRGLSALLQNSETDITTKSATGVVAGSIALLPIDQIEANPFNPRNRFEQDALEELSQSIKELGIIQPVTVRKLGYDKYQLISGERRFRASQIAGLTEIPAYVRIADDKTVLEMAIVENIQREDLNPVEVALSFQRLIEECNLTQEQLSERVGKGRATVTNFLRLLKLPAEIQSALVNKRITMGHARPLIALDDVAQQLDLFKKIINEDLSVRSVEDLAKNTPKAKGAKAEPKSEDLQETQKSLATYFNAKVDVKKQNGKGSIVIKFGSDKEYQRILELIKPN